MVYLRAGLEIFHNARKSLDSNTQPSIGNLGIAIELMLKTLIVKHNPVLLFVGLPDEVQVLFSCPESLPKDFNWRPFDIDLRSFKYKTKELDECISLFYVLFPQHKQELHAYFRLLSSCRNASVHSVLPSFQRYELERLGYLALRVLIILQTTKNISEYAYFTKKEDKKFLLEFKNERIERVKKIIDQAKEKSKHIDTGRSSSSIDGWEFYVTDCPICGSEGVLSGYTEVHVEGHDEDPDVSLDFFADSFECADCGLKLEDADELKLAGIDLFYDRSSELDKWDAEQYEPDGDYM